MAAYSIHIRYTFFPLERSTSKSHPCVYGGKALRLFSPHPQQRITPAHAGKSFKGKTMRKLAAESPPRMRGKVAIYIDFQSYFRITPAHAGKRIAHLLKRLSGRDHPRACGEKALGTCSAMRTLGSPPRMRGKVTEENNMTTDYGITPAHAGKSRSGLLGPAADGDHPRACGEKFKTARRVGRDWGSPPRMRGKE